MLNATRSLRLASALALCVCSLALAARAEASAEAHVYWTDPATNTIGRANLDGTDVNQSFITGTVYPLGIALDADHVYWAELQRIGRADLNGTLDSAGFMNYVGGPRGLDVDANHVYWTTYGTDAISRANLDGTNPEFSFIPLIPDPSRRNRDVVVDAGHVYWTNSRTDTIGRANLDGTDVNQSFITGIGSPSGIAVDAGHVYWTDPATNTIGRANLDGTDVNQSFITRAPAEGVAVDAGHVYWAYYGGIGRANLDGTDVNQSFITGIRTPWGIAVDPPPKPTPPDTDPPDTTAPQTKITKRARNKAEKTELRFKFTSSEPDSSFECRLDKRTFKPCTSPKRVQRLDDGKHKFKVRAIDAAGNVDPSAAKAKFRVVG